MIISYHGHSEFLIQTDMGQNILFDPFPKEVGYPMKRVKADLVVISHHHFDHDHVDKVDGRPIIIDQEGAHSPLPGIRLIGTPAFHDDAGGQQRGTILCFRLETEGLSVLHLGDLGVIPDAETAKKLFMPDILLIPVGGYYTVGAEQAAKTIELLQPRVVIPMHYRTKQGGFEQIDTLDPFLQAMSPTLPSVQPLLRVTKGDLSQQPKLVQLTIGEDDVL